MPRNKASDGVVKLSKASIAHGQRTKNLGPKMRETTMGMRIKHRERITNLAATALDQVIDLPLNPSYALAFPWLSNLAKSFESFVVHGLTLQYVPKCPTTTTGTVILSCDYHGGEGRAKAFTVDFDDLYATPGAISGPVWDSCDFKVEPRRFQFRKYYTRDSTVRSTEVFDPAMLQVGIAANAVPVEIGSLWVAYDIELQTPQLAQPDAQDPVPVGLAQLSLANDVTPTSVESAIVFSTTSSINWNTIGLQVNPSGGVLLQRGAYKVNLTLMVKVPCTLALGGKFQLRIFKDGVLYQNVGADNWATSAVTFDANVDNSDATFPVSMSFVFVCAAQSYLDFMVMNVNAVGTQNISRFGTMFTIEEY